MGRKRLLDEVAALLKEGDEPAAAHLLRQALVEAEDPVLRYLLAGVLMQMGKEVEGWQEEERALEGLEPIKGGPERARRLRDRLLADDETGGH